MELTPYVEAIRSDLVASVTDDQQAVVAERLGRALEPSLQLRLQDLLSEGALELSEQLTSGHVELRLAGRDVRLVYVGPPEEPAPASFEEEGETARLTLRMPEALKERVEEAAAREGSSVNAWLVRAIARGVEGRRFEIQIGKSGRGGSRITGFAQS